MLLICGCRHDKVSLSNIVVICDSTITYSGVISPIIQNNCAVSGCHVSGGTAIGDYTVFAEIKMAADSGKLKDRTIILKNMPPSSPLSDTDLGKIQCWLNAGAPNN